ncbi:MAG: cysteine synthase CysM [Lutibacter sp.]|uniref:cysteine synthase CysM n=1 Tax=Lutibacter sp. TaxID=1925666 RepID=UPI0017A484DF|nr:cysteine synthase CysM [Lutibacter sp.]MBT8316425.1 cysteine synthase CysM [Lutibacter sp.]NNJ57285.1 cysteine synthase CysM [Lutibacter sp.]
MESYNLFNFLGNTPLVKVQRLLVKEGVTLLMKLEGNNIAGSIKDRPAFNMISSALERNEIKKGDFLIEATSGNTGIALAMIAQQFGLHMELVMPENSTKERIQTMQAYGAKVTLTAAEIGIEGAREYAERQVIDKGYFMLNQFANDDNWKAHYKTTGPEIWRDTHGKITHFTSAMGTTGTLMGTSTFLKEKNKAIQIIGVQPTDNSKIPGIRKWPKEFLPKIFNPKKVDEIIEVSEKDAREMTKRLAKEEGVFSGMSGGGAVAASLKLAESLSKGIIVTIIPDRGDRYLSSDLFE